MYIYINIYYINVLYIYKFINRIRIFSNILRSSKAILYYIYVPAGMFMR